MRKLGKLWAIGKACPQLYRPFASIKRALGTDAETAEIARAYDEMPTTSLSSGIFARVPSSLAAVAVRDVHWSDWGREERIAETLLRLGKQNDMAPTTFAKNRERDVHGTLGEEQTKP